jgi:hypothetical protein
LNKIKPSNVEAQAFGGHKLHIIGQVDIRIKNKGKFHKLTFHVMNDAKGVIPILTWCYSNYW